MGRGRRRASARRPITTRQEQRPEHLRGDSASASQAAGPTIPSIAERFRATALRSATRCPRTNGLIGAHPITDGHDPSERVRAVATITGESTEGPPATTSCGDRRRRRWIGWRRHLPQRAGGRRCARFRSLPDLHHATGRRPQSGHRARHRARPCGRRRRNGRADALPAEADNRRFALTSSGGWRANCSQGNSGTQYQWSARWNPREDGFYWVRRLWARSQSVAAADGAPALARTGQSQPAANQSAASTGNVFEYRRNWGRWGKDDQMGAVNLITPAKRAAAAGLVKTGRTVSLSRPF